MRATRIGMLVVLVAAAALTLVFLLRRPTALRYAGMAGGTSAVVLLRLAEGQAAPEQLTIEIGDARIVAARLR